MHNVESGKRDGVEKVLNFAYKYVYEPAHKEKQKVLFSSSACILISRKHLTA